MSFDVLVVPEDPSFDRYILEHLVVRLLKECGKPKARVEVLSSPRAKGYEHAKGLLRGQLLDEYRHKNLFLFLPDADGKDREGDLRVLEREAELRGHRLLCCAAVQEVETWLLAGHQRHLPASWREVRDDVSVKERFFSPFLSTHGDQRRAGGGRDLLMQQALKNYRSILALCPELADLEARIRSVLSTP